MATRKAKNPELAAAAGNVADAGHHVRKAVGQKFDEIGAAVSAELDKAKQAASIKHGRAKRRLDALLMKVEVRLSKARKSLNKVVRSAEKAVEVATKSARTKMTTAQTPSTRKVAPVKVAAKKAGPKNTTAKSGATEKAAPK